MPDTAPQTIAIQIALGETLALEIDVSLDGLDELSLSGATLRAHAKRYPWQADSEAYATLSVGAGIEILEPDETADAPARVRLTWPALDYPLGPGAWVLWVEKASRATPLAAGPFTVSPL